MKYNLIIGFFFFISCISYGQVIEKPTKKRLPTTKGLDNKDLIKSKVSDSIRESNTSTKNNKSIEAKIEDYLIISHVSDTTYVDTTLTIQKEYKFNYLRKDNFGLLPFSNLGQTYNTLSYNFDDNNLMPTFGARSKHFNYMEIEDIYYYHVPTPLTELFFKTAFQQGQLVDAFFTVNTSKQFNFSIAYKGLRSLGKYQHIITSTGNFRFTTNYKTKNNKYSARAHIVMQDVLNEENGGINDDQVPFFETGDPEFLDRSIFDVNFEDAEGLLNGKRFHLDHVYNIINKKDSISSNKLNVRHIISFEDKYYQYDQTSQNDYFGDAFKSSNLRDGVSLENFYNQFQLNFSNNTIGDLQFNVAHNNYNYGYDKVVVLNNINITNRLKGDIISVGGKYLKQFDKFELKGEIGINVTGDFDGNYLFGQASFNITDDIVVRANINHSSKAPNYNTLLYQSNYINYNWQNNFNNTETQQVAFELGSKKFGALSINYATISDYTYFKIDEVSGFVKPFQNDKTISYLKVKLENELKFGKFALNNTLLYQNVTDENSTINAPEFVTRSSLYYFNHLFKKAMFLQTGVTLNYFTEYNMNAYDPLLSEFYVQTETKYGAFPRVDFFLNAKIKQTRIYLKAEHINSAWTGYDYYTAPNYPYRDFTIRFGLVWNFFL